MNNKLATPDRPDAEPTVYGRPPAASKSPVSPRRNDDVRNVYNALLWRLRSRCGDESCAVLGFSGFAARSGTSTIAANLALYAAAEQLGRVLLVDANPGKNSLSKQFQCETEEGLFDVMAGAIAPAECQTAVVGEEVEVLSSGACGAGHPLSPRQKFVEEMLAGFRAEYDLVLFDLPPAELLGPALPLAKELAGVVLVARSEAVPRREAERVLRQLQQDGVRVAGAVLNEHREYLPRWLRNWL
jgi:Mrp family chromosome partitioning ATPase